MKGSLNLFVDRTLYETARTFCREKPRKGRRNVSELTEQLWISFLRKKRVKLPPLFKTGKNGKVAK